MWQLSMTLFAAWFHYCITYDTVILSTLKLKKMTVEDLVASSKVLAVGVKNFSLPKFGIYSQAYSAGNSDSPFASLMRIFPNQKALPMENPLVVISSDDDANRSTTDIVYTRKDLHDLLASDENFKGYQTVIISSEDAFEEGLVRRKRVSSNVNFDDEPSSHVSKATQRSSASDRHDMPVVLPPPNPSQKTTCLLYMEAFDIVIPNSRYLTVDSEGKNKYSSEPDHYKCNINRQGGASFIIDVEVEEDIQDAKKEFSLKSGTAITFQLDFVRSRNGYWYLDGTTLKNSFKITAVGSEQGLTVSNGTATNRVDVGAVFNRNFACYQTDAAVFNVSGDTNPTHVGIVLRNFEVTLGVAGNKTKFGYHTSDCVGTFSAGTWMGIIVSVVFLSILLFGYLMVQSIHTMDRFDDLKQKQIIINFKD
ncbi:hypothetical protein LOAG_17634 [Loa loa]|uniref:V-type proton ATPase subunit S1/VOA1 transmembrane domain-containing protein n=2 Tax=Loa loa TaxID=7209 RepID=A0A1S0UK58_LOALO|nr:hypothetical protein LOAG_17634 [Loa loa]EJD75174.1 hypothetical protein LOAG_17634 [Loa loa]